MSAKLSADPDNFPALNFLIRALEDLQNQESSNQKIGTAKGKGREEEEKRKTKEKVKSKAVSDSTGFTTLKKHKVTS